jgi:hypothetical protein
MPRGVPRARASALALLVALAGATAAGAGCAGGSSDAKPAPTLASSADSAAAFEAIREAWRDPARTNPAALRARIERFIAQYPSDGLVPLAHVFLALVAIQEEDFPTADAQLALGATMPPGTARELWTVAKARRSRLRGDAEAAMELLRPEVGKNVDPLVRETFQEELTLTALATHRDYEAITYMDAWLRASPEEDREATGRHVASMVEKLPKEVLVGALQAMRTRRSTFGYGADIERILAQRLVEIATTSGDAQLARLLLDPDAGAVVVEGDAGVELGELATSRRGLNVVEGRTVGLLLPTASPALRDESADVLRGVMWAMGLPRGVRGPAAVAAPTSSKPRSAPAVPAPTPTPSQDAGAVRTACAPAEPAPPLAEPGPEDAVRLVTRDDAGSVDRTEGSLDELAGEGAAVVIAGLDPDTADRALRWGEARGVSVVALTPPTRANSVGAFGFVLGESRGDVIAALMRAAASLATDKVAPVVDASEVGRFPPQGGKLDGLTLLPPVSCDIPPVRAGDPRFPLSQWEKDKARAWLVSGSADCSQDLVGELSKGASTGGTRGVVAMTLEAATLPPHPTTLRVLSASAGVVPTSAGDPRDDELRRFEGALGDPTWWTALGRDAAVLARLAARGLPDGEASEAHAVSERRSQARDALLAARARLWSTEATGWGEGTPPRVMRRTVCAEESKK